MPSKLTIFQSESIQGDALTTIAAATSAGSEVFLTDTMKGRLTYRQIGFSGTRHSDHLAALAAFQARILSQTHELSDQMIRQNFYRDGKMPDRQENIRRWPTVTTRG